MKKKICMGLVLLLACLLLTACGGPEATYKKAQELLSQGKYAEAAEKFESIGSFEDASTLTIYCKACALCEAGNFETGISALEKLGDYKDSPMRITYYTARSWDDGSLGTTEFEWMEKALSFYGENPLYLDSAERISVLKTRIEEAKTALYDAAVVLMNTGKYEQAIVAFERIKKYRDSATQIKACETAFRAGKYDAAVELMNAGKYSEAYDAFIALNGHKDSQTKASSIYDKAMEEKRSKAKVGDYITFGTYEQDNNTQNGKEAIEWLVLARENNRLLVISRYALDYEPYNKNFTNVTWETCTLRTWLNDNFLKAAFSRAEQAMIPTVTVSADKNPDRSTNPGNATQDKVFLLSIPEVNRYFTSDGAKKCQPTAYAKQQCFSMFDNGFCWWWLRSPGYRQDYAASVFIDGGVYESGSYVFDDDNAVRPALWINLNP